MTSASRAKLTPQAVLLLATIAAAGCSGSSYDMAEVSGSVTLGGKPLADANVSFQPVSASGQIAPGPGSWAKTDAAGRFVLRLVEPDRPGAVVGQHRVRITTAREKDPQSDSGETTAEVVPQRYRDGSVQFEVPPDGTDQANFELDSAA